MESGRVDARRSRNDADRTDLFNEMYATYAPRVRALAESRLRGRGLADDVVQETFLRVHRNLDRFDLSMPPWPWLKMIATNICTDVLRTRHVWSEQLVDDAGLSEVAGGEAPADAWLAKERRQGIATVLSGMNARQRRALVLTGVEGWRAEQVADLEGSTVTAVRATLKRGRQAFKSSYLALAAERGLLGVGAVLGTASSALRKLRSMASSSASTSAMLGPLQLASAAFVSVALVGGLVVVAGPWSLAFGALDQIAEKTPTPTTAATGAPASSDASAPVEVAAAGQDLSPSQSPSPAIATVDVALPETDTAASIAATTALDQEAEGTLLASVQASVGSDSRADVTPSVTAVWADLYCEHSEVRRAACSALASAVEAPGEL